MLTYSIAEAAERLSELVDAASAGEPVILTRLGRPVAVLKPASQPHLSITPEMYDRLSDLRSRWPPIDEAAVTIIREMREDYP